MGIGRGVRGDEGGGWGCWVERDNKLGMSPLILILEKSSYSFLGDMFF